RWRGKGSRALRSARTSVSSIGASMETVGTTPLGWYESKSQMANIVPPPAAPSAISTTAAYATGRGRRNGRFGGAYEGVGALFGGSGAGSGAATGAAAGAILISTGSTFATGCDGAGFISGGRIGGGGMTGVALGTTTVSTGSTGAA